MSAPTTVWQADPSMTSPIRSFFTALFTRRSWAELLYALLGLPLGVVGFVFTVTTLSLSAGLLITFVGLPLMVATGIGARQLGVGMRLLANALIGAKVAPLGPIRLAPGLAGWVKCLRDPSVWRARLYLLVKLPVGVASFAVAVAFYTYGLGGATYAIWRPFLPCNSDSPDGRCHRGANFGPSYTLDTPWRIVCTTLAGLLLILLAPWVVRGVIQLDGLLVRVLLGPTRSSLRVAELEQTRAHAVDDSAATLRRIERDLHDGTQARLVALAMNVGLAKEKLAEGADPAEAQRLLETAHSTAKDAIVELRDLARGIHPPVLDAGLDTALATLAAHSAVPVSLRTAITSRPSPAIETIAYFCTAELLTNVAKHSGAASAVLDVRTVNDVLRVQVSDDGRGGARVGAGSGLTGLSERIRTVDGRLSVSSPAGGPTVVSVDLPLQSRSS
ncbi:MAG: sensor histidine kinase [Jatrophihabitantaceae bacterium]